MRFFDRVKQYRLSVFAILYVVCSTIPALKIGISIYIDYPTPFALAYVWMALISVIVSLVLERFIGRRRSMPPFVAIVVAVVAGIATGFATVWITSISWLLIACVVFHQCP